MCGHHYRVARPSLPDATAVYDVDGFPLLSRDPVPAGLLDPLQAQGRREGRHEKNPQN
jgi:hypothetical protein